MKYDFTTIYDRHGKDALAVDNMGDGQAPDLPKEGFDAIPMWVADMNFATVPTVQEALTERIKHPLFGYFPPSEDILIPSSAGRRKGTELSALAKSTSAMRTAYSAA